MSDNDKQLPTITAKDVAINGRGVQLTNLQEALRYAATVFDSGIAPASVKNAKQLFVIMQAGMEAGLGGQAAINSIAVVKGRPTWYSKAAKGRVLASGFCKDWQQGVQDEGDDRYGWVKTRRKGLEGEQETRFSVLDAKNLGCYNTNPCYKTQLDNMLLCRAIGRHVADWFGDVMLNLRTYEEVRDSDWPDNSRPEAIEAPTEADPLMIQAEIENEKSQDSQAEPEAAADTLFG